MRKEVCRQANALGAIAVPPNGPNLVPQPSRKDGKRRTDSKRFGTKFKTLLPTHKGGSVLGRIALSQKFRYVERPIEETISVGLQEPTKDQAEGVTVTRKELIQHCIRMASLKKAIEENMKSVVEHNKKLEEIRDDLQKMIESEEKFYGVKMK